MPLTKAEKGDRIATVIWNWLQEVKNIQFVPWVVHPLTPDGKPNPKYDQIKAIMQDVHDKMVQDLELVILTTVAEIRKEEKDETAKEMETTKDAKTS